MDAVATLTIISKPDCHLCDVAREIVDVVVADCDEDAVSVEEVSILDDPALYARGGRRSRSCSSTIACTRTGASMPRLRRRWMRDAGCRDAGCRDAHPFPKGPA
jgi:hypothetical protein